MSGDRDRLFDRTGSWLARDAGCRPRGTGASRRLAPGTALPGGWRIGSVLGEGGMGVVYEAARDGDPARSAIKVLHCSEDVTPEIAARFRDEAAIAASLHHPNLVPVTGSGATADGSPFLVLPLLEGELLADLLSRRGSLPVAESAAILEQVLLGLSAAHDRGVVHRDLKPANVFLARETGGRIVARVFDFGVARLLGPPGDDLAADPSPARPADDSGPPSRLTRDGRVMGTPGYLAPEVASLSSAADLRSDLFSVAVMAFEMLSGRLPFTGDTVREVLLRTVECPAPPLRSLVPGLPPSMERLVDRGLRKDPADRFQTAAEFLSTLRAAAGGVRG